MNEPVWVTEEDCLSFHDKLLARFGGGSGVLDKGLLLSALARPQHIFVYEKPSLFDLAAAYAHGIIKNHPFIDGNKRTALATCLVFLSENGCLSQEKLDVDAWEQLVLDVAASRIDREETTKRLGKVLA